MMKGCLKIFGLVFSVFRDWRKYRHIAKSDGKKTSMRFGIRVIIMSLFAGACFFAALYGLNMLGTGLTETVFGVVLLVLFGVSAAVLFVRSFFCFLFQLLLNRSLVTWLALLAFIASVAVPVYLLLSGVVF